MTGNDRGTWFMPDMGDEVLVAFEHGDPHLPLEWTDHNEEDPGIRLVELFA